MILLPADTLGIIFSYCDYFTQQKVKLASKKWHRYITKLDAENQMIFVQQIISNLGVFSISEALRLEYHMDPDPVHRIARLRRTAVFELKVRCLRETRNTPYNCLHWVAQHWDRHFLSDRKTIELFCNATSLKNIEEIDITSIYRSVLERPGFPFFLDRPDFPFFSKMMEVLAHLPDIRNIHLVGRQNPYTLQPVPIAFDYTALIELLRTRPLISLSFSFMYFDLETHSAIVEHFSKHNSSNLLFKSCTLPFCHSFINSPNITTELTL